MDLFAPEMAPVASASAAPGRGKKVVSAVKESIFFPSGGKPKSGCLRKNGVAALLGQFRRGCYFKLTLIWIC